MTNVFNLKDCRLNNGVLVSSKFIRGYCGTIAIYPFLKLDVEFDKSEERENVNLNIDGIELYGSYENPDYAFRHVQPSERYAQSTHIPAKFEDLSRFTTLDHGTFFITRRPLATKFSTSLSLDQNTNMSVVHPSSELGALSMDIGTMLENMGVPPINTRIIREEIFMRLGFPRTNVTRDYPHINPGVLFRLYTENIGKGIRGRRDYTNPLIVINQTQEEVKKGISGK